jgi:hypothetical protein
MINYSSPSTEKTAPVLEGDKNHIKLHFKTLICMAKISFFSCDALVFLLLIFVCV